MKKLTALLAGVLLNTLLLSNTTYAETYLIKDSGVYQVANNKAYKVEIVDGVMYTTNEWHPTNTKGYTDEYVKYKQYQVAKHANRFIAKAYGRYDDE